MSTVEHLLIAESGTDDRSRYTIMVALRVDDCEELTASLADASDEQALGVLQRLAPPIAIVFASKRKVEALGEDWRCIFMRELAGYRFRLGRGKGQPLIGHVPREMPLDFTWIDDYLTSGSFGLVRVKIRQARDERLLTLPRLVARIFKEALEDDASRPSAARARYDALAPLVKSVEDLGLHVSYCAGITSEAIVRTSQPS